MADHRTRGAQLRTPAPTLEPDDALLARLSSLAASGAPAPAGAAAPRMTWRVGLAAASVAAVLVGGTWLTGFADNGSPAPPATPPSGPTVLPSTTPDASPDEATTDAPDETVEESSSDSTFGSTGPGPGAGPSASGQSDDTSHGPDEDGPTSTPGVGQGHEPGDHATPDHQGQGPDDHAGDHPDEHAAQKADNAHQAAGEHPGGGAGGRPAR